MDRRFKAERSAEEISDIALAVGELKNIGADESIVDSLLSSWHVLLDTDGYALFMDIYRKVTGC